MKGSHHFLDPILTHCNLAYFLPLLASGSGDLSRLDYVFKVLGTSYLAFLDGFVLLLITLLLVADGIDQVPLAR